MKKWAVVAILSLFLGVLFPWSPVPSPGSGHPGADIASSAQSAPAAASGTALIFPQIANGSSGGIAYRSSVLLINHTERSAAGLLQIYGNTGIPLPLGTSLGRADSFSFALGAGQALRFETDGTGPLKTGWVKVVADAELSGFATFTVTDDKGIFQSEVGIGNSPPAYRLMILAENTRGNSSAFALCNPDPGRNANLLFELRSLNGSLVASKTEVLSALAQKAEYVTETFGQADLRDFSGVLVLSSDLPISLVALRSRGANYTSLPSVPPPASGQTARDLVFPRIGDGPLGDVRLQTAFWIFNNSEESQAATLELFTNDGTPMAVTIGPTTASRFTVTIPALGAAELITGGRSNPGTIGWAKITSDRPLGSGAGLTIREKNNGSFVSEIGVPGLSTEAKSLFYVREKGEILTGLALSNASADNRVVRLRLYFDSSGQEGSGTGKVSIREQDPVAERVLHLSAFTGLGQFIYELFPQVPGIAARDFVGRLEITSWDARFGEDIPAPVAGLSLLCRGSKYTSLPIAPYRPDARPLSAFDPKVDDLIGRMTLDEKIGQMTQAERGSLREGDIQNYFIGSVLSGGGSGPASNQVDAWADMYDDFQSQALKTRLKIPILYGIDAVHGHNNVRGAVIFPHNIGLGASRNPALAEIAGRITASEVRATGMNWTFSPVVAVPRDERWGRTYEGFGEDPDLVQAMGRAAVLGYQRSSLADPSGIVACAKHYLGDGGTRWGTGNPIDQGDTQMDEATLRRVHLPGYRAAVQAGVGTIMVSFSSWNGQKMTGNRYLLTDVLKGELGFEGFLISDWAAIDQLPGGSYRAQVKAAINAGIDMGMVPERHQEFFVTLKSLVLAGEIPVSRVDDAVRRILRVKFAAGLFDRSPFSDHSYRTRLGSAEHREAAREAVRQSLVLLKNRDGLLPLSKNLRRVMVSGLSADDIGRQCGGWTISWQGSAGNITTGTTILQAIRQSVAVSTQVVHSPDGTNAAGADVAIAIIGEPPYAEGPGDSCHAEPFRAGYRRHRQYQAKRNSAGGYSGFGSASDPRFRP